MLKVAAIGDRESVLGFKALGMDTFIPYGKNECLKLMKDIVSDESYAIIFITEEYGEYCKEIIKKNEDNINPAIILIPGVKNNTGEGMHLVSRSIEKAIGSQLPE